MTPNSTAKQAASEPITSPKARKPRRLRIGPIEIRRMGELLAQRLSESEACATLGIAPRSWFRWKCRQRNGGKFAALLDGIMGQKIAAHLDNIDAKSAKDWRASAYILSVTDANRFQTSGGQVQINVPQPALALATIYSWLTTARAELEAEQAGQVVDVKAKQLPQRIESEAPQPRCPPVSPPFKLPGSA